MGIRILVVDDATFVRDMIKKQLRDKVPGAEVIDAADGMRALVAIKNQPPDLILSDALMPKMDGREMCRLIKKDSQLSKIKVVIMTSLSTRPRDKSAAFKEFKVDEYLQKPLSFNLLRNILERFLA